MVRLVRNAVIGLFLLLFYFPANATHIVGGELNYRYLGNSLYEIRLTVYRDCYYGIPAFDNPASLGVFDQNNNLVTFIDMPYRGSDTLENSINTPCFEAPTDICFEVTTYIDTIVLPPNPGGYQLAYQRCCRNNALVNIVFPGVTGATYYANIQSSIVTTVNSNPQFQNEPPTFICSFAPFTFDHSAFDFDGDSLVYELCYPFTGGNTSVPIPSPPFNPPYQQVQFAAPYSLNNSLGGPQPLSIDPQTGLLTAIPGVVGQFLYGVCVKEYRNGFYLSTTRRDFQINVIACPTLLLALYEAPEVQCGNNTFQFTNTSIGAFSYFWDFGTGNAADTSMDVNPVFTFPDTGTYDVTLIATSSFSSSCKDTIVKTVRIYPEYIADFTFEIPLCNYNIPFKDTATLLSGIPVAWNWSFDDGTNSTQDDPVHAFPGPGNYDVTFISTSAGGCKDTVTKTVSLDTVLTIISKQTTHALCYGDCNGSAGVITAGGTLPHQYVWNDPGGQTSPEAINLCAGNYMVTVTDSNGCELTENFIIQQPALLVSTEITTEAYCFGNCIGTTLINPVGGTPGYSITWNEPGINPDFYINQLCEGIYYYTITDNNGCVYSDSVSVIYSEYIPPVDATVEDDTIYLGQTTVVHSTVNPGYQYSWTPPEGLNTPTASNSVAGPLQTVTYYIEIADSNGCINVDSVTIWVRIATCEEPEIFIPNAFTPDNDGINDILFFRGNSVNKLYLTIYDRWGQQVFETDNKKKGWDGTYKGKEAGAGVYVYYVEGTCYGGYSFFKKGNITLMR